MVSKSHPKARRKPSKTRPRARRPELLAAIGERMKRARTEILEISQQGLGAKLTGSTHGRGIQDNERGLKMPSGDTLAHLVNQGVSANWILTGTGDMRVSEEPGSWTRVTHPLTHAPLLALSPALVSQIAPGQTLAPELLGWTVQDSSMTPMLQVGDIAILKPASADVTTGIVLVQLRDKSCLLRRLVIEADGAWTVSASNRGFGTVQYSKQEMEHPWRLLRILGWMVARYSVPAAS